MATNELANKEIATGTGAYLVLARDDAGTVSVSVRLDEPPADGDREVVGRTVQTVLDRTVSLLEKRGYKPESLTQDQFPEIASPTQEVIAATSVTVPERKTDDDIINDFGQAANLGITGFGPRMTGDRDLREEKGGFRGRERRVDPSEQETDGSGGRRGHRSNRGGKPRGING